jgi:hypothetical protein
MYMVIKVKIGMKVKKLKAQTTQTSKKTITL